MNISHASSLSQCVIADLPHLVDLVLPSRFALYNELAIFYAVSHLRTIAETYLVLSSVSFPHSLRTVNSTFRTDLPPLISLDIVDNTRIVMPSCFRNLRHLRHIFTPASLMLILHDSFVDCEGDIALHVTESHLLIEPDAFHNTRYTLVRNG